LLRTSLTPNEKEISHGRVLWQTCSACFAMGLLASSVG
jgi:hypothetical protein